MSAVALGLTVGSQDKKIEGHDALPSFQPLARRLAHAPALFAPTTAPFVRNQARLEVCKSRAKSFQCLLGLLVRMMVNQGSRRDTWIKTSPPPLRRPRLIAPISSTFLRCCTLIAEMPHSRHPCTLCPTLRVSRQ